MRRTPTCGTKDCATHVDRRFSPRRACTYGVLTVAGPGVVTGMTTFRRLPDGSAEVVVAHRHAGAWTPPRPVAEPAASALIAAHNPPIFAPDSRPPR